MNDTTILFSYQREEASRDEREDVIRILRKFSVFNGAYVKYGREHVQTIGDESRVLAAVSCIAYHNRLAQAVIECLTDYSSAFPDPNVIKMTFKCHR